MSSGDNFKALKGTAVHKSLQLLGLRKLAEQNKEKFFEDEVGSKWKIKDGTPEKTIKAAIDYYEPRYRFKWTDEDKEECLDLVRKAIEFNDGEFNPLTSNVVSVEKPFDIELSDRWAAYEFKYKDEVLKGNLRLKGTIDFLESPQMGVLHLVDYKTGGYLTVWPTKKVKDYDYFRNEDIQLRLYYLALSEILPEYKRILISIFYIRLGKAFTICFEPEDIIKTKEMIRENFEKVKNTIRPQLNKGFWCNKLCAYGMNKQPGSDLTICEFMKKEIYQIGIQKTTEKYSNGAFSTYKAPGT